MNENLSRSQNYTMSRQPQSPDMGWSLRCDVCERTGRHTLLGYIDTDGRIWRPLIGASDPDDAIPVRLIEGGDVSAPPRLRCPAGHTRRRTAVSLRRMLDEKPDSGDILF
jgi:hypothetical protein